MILRKGHIFVYYGEGKGKTSLAVGQGMRAIGEELRVVMIQYMDYNHTKEMIPLKKLEPDFRIFRFEKIRTSFDEADEGMKKEISTEVKNAFNFTKKIMDTGECDMLILDGIFDAVEREYISEHELSDALSKRPSYMDVITTGTHRSKLVADQADFVYRICTEKTICEE